MSAWDLRKSTDLGPGSRYELLFKIASGGMATVYVARLRAGQGVRRLVAVKRAHPNLTEDPEFRKMLIAEARVGAQIHHANVVAVQDVEELDGELLIVMDYVEGASLAQLAPLADMPIAVRVVLDAAAGLHAAHEQVDEDDRPLGIIHRDVSPHNLLVGLDGVTRVTDFGIAKSAHASVVTRTGAVRGKLAYMAPEYLGTGVADRRIDVFALGVVLWEALTGSRLFQAATEQETLVMVEQCEPPHPPGVPAPIDAVVMTALERDPDRRFATAAELRDALENAARASGVLATHAEVAAMVGERRKEPLAARRAAIRGSSPSLSPEEPATSTFSRELAQRDETNTVSLPGVASVTSPPPRKSTWTVPMLLLGAALLVIVAVRLWPRPVPTPAAPPAETSVAAPPPPVVIAPPAVSSVVVAPPPPVVTKRPRRHPVAPPPSVEPAPAGDHSKPNPYLNQAP